MEHHGTSVSISQHISQRISQRIQIGPVPPPYISDDSSRMSQPECRFHAGSGKLDKYSVRHWQVMLHFADATTMTMYATWARW